MSDCVVIVDNVFKFINASNQTVMGKFFNDMEALQEKMFERGKIITIIILDHVSRENKDEFMPVSKNKMGGAAHIPRFSKVIVNLFPIKGMNNRIGVTLTKDRFHERKNTIDILERVSEPMPGFRYINSITEDELRKGYNGNSGVSLTDAQQKLFRQLMKSNPKPTNKEIAVRLGISERSVYDWKKKLGI